MICDIYNSVILLSFNAAIQALHTINIHFRHVDFNDEHYFNIRQHLILYEYFIAKLTEV